MALQDLRAILLDNETLKTLDERIQKAYNRLVVSIGTMSNLTGASVVQLRYWDKRNLITSKAGGNGNKREYSLADLKRLIWITQVLSLEGAKPSDIARFFEKVPESQELLDAILAYQPSGSVLAMPAEKNLNTITYASFYEFMGPHLGQFILTLLWNSLHPETGFVIPISGEGGPFPENGDINDALRILGESVFCFVDNISNVHFWVQNPIYFQSPDAYKLEQMKIASDVFQGPLYLLSRHGHAPSNAMHTELDALAHLLKLIVQWAEEWKSIGVPAVSLSSHTTQKDLTLLHLSMLTDYIIGLAAEREKPWTFGCLLAPANPEDPRHRHTLTIVAQSKESPHPLGTVLEPREGISSFAYKTGQIVNVGFAEQEPRIARREVEETTKSAIAVPLSCLEDSDAVLYVASDHPTTFTPSDELLLALLGNLVAKRQVLNGLTQQACVNRIRSIVSDPCVVDSLFRGFGTNDQFLKTLERRIEHIQDGSGDDFSLLTVDIDNSHAIWDKVHDEALLKDAWQWIGKATQNFLKPEDRLYRIYVDRYAAILDIDDQKEILKLAERLHKALKVGLIHVGRSGWDHPPVQFTTRVAIVLAKSEVIRSLPMNPQERRQFLVDRLHEVLRFGKRRGGDLIAYWTPQGPEQFGG
jgi:DNA-binding transcriptional MerR regulator/GGDEF domain-containing protein